MICSGFTGASAMPSKIVIRRPTVMIAFKNQKNAMEKLCETAVKTHLGDISALPEELAAYVNRVYFEFIAIYLNILRQRDKKPLDWTPETLSIDPELAENMRHFFSDNQHITKEFFILNAKMLRLKDIDKERQPNLYRHAIDDILQLRDRPLGPRE
jgi:hypothetical protein